ncbi:glycoside hydrolase family 7 protein [Hydnum rufescens UP504]|uniref:Glucanase n=1 Tax=Hydnum rufescens UP504 TaxID=1448309 RepID=A0A9P6B5Q9_9AGAM|nr:glycoside hydrolase family 7 protein [Hydnum rufescens UP504]
MHTSVAFVLFSLLTAVCGQQIGTLTTESHPSLTWSKCTTSGGCTVQEGSVVLDANWRWLHSKTGSTNCYTGNTWDTTLCPDPATCAANCALDGADYTGTYGITTAGDALTLKFVTHGPYSTNIGSRVYLMASTTKYQMFMLRNQEFTFDVDVSNLPCGLNGALYFAGMDADGGMAKYPTNKAGAQYGTGYCDSQCPHDIKFINGEANVLNWTPSSNNGNSGTGQYGTCCTEMDVWEANSVSAAYTPHACTVHGQTRCSGSGLYGGVCDKDGCDFNSYRMGNTTFYGRGLAVDTSSKFTVVTQFITVDNTSTGALSEIRRLYVQNGKKAAFGDTNSFESKGGLTGMGTAFSKGMVLVMSLWDDYAENMLWLDSDYPATKSVTTPGVARGTCSPSSGLPASVEANSPGSSVTYSNIKFGDIGTTF